MKAQPFPFSFLFNSRSRFLYKHCRFGSRSRFLHKHCRFDSRSRFLHKHCRFDSRSRFLYKHCRFGSRSRFLHKHCRFDSRSRFLHKHCRFGSHSRFLYRHCRFDSRSRCFLPRPRRHIRQTDRYRYSTGKSRRKATAWSKPPSYPLPFLSLLPEYRTLHSMREQREAFSPSAADPADTLGAAAAVFADLADPTVQDPDQKEQQDHAG